MPLIEEASMELTYINTNKSGHLNDLIWKIKAEKHVEAEKLHMARTLMSSR